MIIAEFLFCLTIPLLAIEDIKDNWQYYFPRFSCRSLSVEGGDGVQLFVETYIGF